MHIAKLIRRRFPERANGIIAVLTVLSLSAIAVGIGLLYLN